jgi:tetratricopeptide (TPR) repeat protein
MNKANNSLIPVNQKLGRISNLIEIFNKIVFKEIPSIFNKGFFLLNDKHLTPEECNIFFYLENNSKYLYYRHDYLYQATSKSSYTEAIELFQKILEIDQNHIWSMYMIGIGYMKIGKYKIAIEWFKKSSNSKESEALALYYEGVCWGILKHKKNATLAFDNAIKYDNNLAKAFYGKGEIFHLEKNIAKAIQSYTKAIELSPSFYPAYLERGQLYLKQENYKLACKDYTRFIQYSRNYKNNHKIKETLDMRTWVYFLCLSENIGDFSFLSEYEAVIPSDFKIDSKYLNIHTHDYTKSMIETTLNLLSQNESDAQIFFERGIFMKKINEYFAERCFTNAIELNPEFSQAYFERSKIRVELNMHEEAQSDLKIHRNLSQ